MEKKEFAKHDKIAVDADDIPVVHDDVALPTPSLVIMNSFLFLFVMFSFT